MNDRVKERSWRGNLTWERKRKRGKNGHREKTIEGQNENINNFWHKVRSSTAQVQSQWKIVLKQLVTCQCTFTFVRYYDISISILCGEHCFISSGHRCLVTVSIPQMVLWYFEWTPNPSYSVFLCLSPTHQILSLFKAAQFFATITDLSIQYCIKYIVSPINVYGLLIVS